MRHNDTMTDNDQRPDARAVLLFIWWPIVLVALSGGVIMLTVFLSGASFSTDPLPLVILALIALGGLAFVPLLVKTTRSEFRGRGFSGFWKSFRNTNWGEGQ